MQPKRLIISVLVVILMFGAAVLSVAAAQTPFELTVEANPSIVNSNEPVILQAGDKLEVNLTVNSNPNALLYSFYVDYDNDVFTLDADAEGNVNFKAGSLYTDSAIKVNTINEERIKCIVNDLNSNEDNNKTGILVTFTFTVNKDFHGTAGITVVMDSTDIIDRDYNEIPVKINNNLSASDVHKLVGEPKEDKGDCTTDATITHKCSVCGDIVFVTAKAPGHVEATDAAVDATCTTAGKTEGKHCSVCNEVLQAQEEIPALGHTEVVDAAVEATCTESGLTEGKHCSVCNEVLKAQETVAAKGHTEVIDAGKEPTESETGLTEGSHCSVCNEVLKAQEEIPAIEPEKDYTFLIWIVIIVAVLAAGGVVAFLVFKKKKK